MTNSYDLVNDLATVTPQAMPFIGGFNFTNRYGLSSGASNFNIFAHGLELNGVAVVVQNKCHDCECNGSGSSRLRP